MYLNKLNLCEKLWESTYSLL